MRSPVEAAAKDQDVVIENKVRNTSILNWR